MNKELRRTLKEVLIASFSVFSGDSEGKSTKNIIVSDLNLGPPTSEAGVLPEALRVLV
jgi:hypothetical protein